jgi:hypothetical protein
MILLIGGKVLPGVGSAPKRPRKTQPQPPTSGLGRAKKPKEVHPTTPAPPAAAAPAPPMPVQVSYLAFYNLNAFKWYFKKDTRV